MYLQTTNGCCPLPEADTAPIDAESPRKRVRLLESRSLEKRPCLPGSGARGQTLGVHRAPVAVTSWL